MKARMLDIEEIKTLFKIYDNTIETNSICIYINNINCERVHIWGDTIKYDSNTEDVIVSFNDNMIAIFSINIIDRVIVHI